MASLTKEGCGPPAFRGLCEGLTTPPHKKSNVTKLTTNKKRPGPNYDNQWRGITDSRFASWNVRSLYRPGAIYQLLTELKRYHITIAALQEVRWPGNGECALDDGFMLFYSGNLDGKHINGTGFMVANKNVSSVLRFDAISERICVLRLKGKFSNITIINAYAPTELADEETKDSFYDDLENVYEQAPQYDVKILLGDFNAKVGKEEVFMPAIGRHSKHDRSNDNGIRLISFASSKNMVIMSTVFPHKNIHKGTWKSPDGQTVNQIDHVLVDSRHKNSIKDVKLLEVLIATAITIC
ncbi:craniofacial development protein 2-like [Colias croceus]|uniref:craniofacial development protein 2-like n=1 Tax=Colias crocea TaxID=72248 RepID=UPI001E27DF30|nr:craniofacial development protein 2-like [Colias croceus]